MLSQIPYTPPSNSVFLQVITRNNILVMSLSNGHLIRSDVSTAESTIEGKFLIFQFQLPPTIIHKISRLQENQKKRFTKSFWIQQESTFWYPTSPILCSMNFQISMDTQDNYYLHISSKKPRTVPKMKVRRHY
jgi:hypothetical protein